MAELELILRIPTGGAEMEIPTRERRFETGVQSDGKNFCLPQRRETDAVGDTGG
jgi:hypothetical protein